MRAKAEVVVIQALSEMKSNLRIADERRLAAGVPVERVARENSFIDANVARRARIVSIGRRFPVAAFED
jgi:hypothetical protein